MQTTSCTLAALRPVAPGIGADVQVQQNGIQSLKVAFTTSRCVVVETAATSKPICARGAPLLFIH